MAGKEQLVSLIPVRDMNRAIKFYTKMLGGKMGYRGQGDMKDSWASVSLHGHDLWLIEPEARESRKLAYTVFLVKDLKAYVTGLVAKGVKFQKAEKNTPQTKIEGPIARDVWGASAVFKDSEGNVLMAWQNDPPM